VEYLKKQKFDVKPTDLRYDLVSESCTCTVYDKDTDTHSPAKECYGDCGDRLLKDFKLLAGKHFRPATWSTTWPTWRGNVPIIVTFSELLDIPRKLAPSGGSQFAMEWDLVREPGRGRKRVWIAIWLVHHDAPLGRMYFF